jgi:hypothetical protein
MSSAPLSRWAPLCQDLQAHVPGYPAGIPMAGHRVRSAIAAARHPKPVPAPTRAPLRSERRARGPLLDRHQLAIAMLKQPCTVIRTRATSM